MTLATAQQKRLGRPLSAVYVARLVPEGISSPIGLAASCAIVGFLFGILESLLRGVYGLLRWHVNDPDLWINWHTPWMAPIAQALWFAAMGTLCSLIALLLPRLTRSVLPYLLTALGIWSAIDVIVGLHPAAVALLVAGLVTRIAPWVNRRLLHRITPIEWLGLAGLWLVLLATTELGPLISDRLATGPVPSPGKPNVLLVVLDTVRADNMSLYEYARDTSPSLDQWASRGVVFNQARATAPYTLGSHASLFTGRWMSHTSARVNAALDGRHTTLADHLRAQGYATGGFVGNIFYGSAHYGLSRGFSHYHDIPGNITRRVTPREILRSSRLGAWLITYFEHKFRILAPMQRMRLDATEVNREAMGWIDGNRSSGRPFFAFVNYFDAHSPYSLPPHAPQPFSTITADRLEAKMQALQDLEDRRDRDQRSVDLKELEALRREVHEALRGAYDDGISWIDHSLDQLLRALDRRGLLANTVVVITADHGEMLGEHNLIGHGNTLHRPVVHVPLVVLGPGVPRGTRVERPVSLRNVPATVLDLIGDPRRDVFPGRSLCEEETVMEHDFVLSEMEYMPWMPHNDRTAAAFGPMLLATDGRWSYHRQRHVKAGVIERLYDLEADPGEQRDLSQESALHGILMRLREQTLVLDPMAKSEEPRPHP